MASSAKSFAQRHRYEVDANRELIGFGAGNLVSGLAQGFFYAGARALLASHWAVASGPTVQLTTGMFSVYAREPASGRAEALRRSQLALASEKDTSHPFFWAPFVLVGDGGPTGP